MTSGEPTATEPELDDGFYAALLDDNAEDLYENAPCAYLSMVPDGTIIKANRTFLTWTGFDRDAVVGRRRLQDLLAPGDRIFYETHVAPMLRLQGHVREIAVEVVRADGSRFPALVNGMLRPASDDAAPVARFVLFDATERRAYEREVLAERRRAEASEARALELARTLQASFLPPAMPSVPGLDLGGAYRPAGDGSVVGGDFYDVFEIGDGRWAVVLGDVAGKGPAAAAVTSLARHTVRAEALRTPDPSDVLGALHDTLAREGAGMVTAVLAFADVGRGGVRLTLSCGGHHRPLVVRSGGDVVPVGETGRVLGVLERPSLTDATVDLAPGDAMVLFTDGVTEARADREFFGDERLHQLLVELHDRSAAELADEVVATTVAFQHGDARDDIAVVALKPNVG